MARLGRGFSVKCFLSLVFVKTLESIRVRQCNGFPKEVVEPLSLEAVKRKVDVALSDMV